MSELEKVARQLEAKVNRLREINAELRAASLELLVIIEEAEGQPKLGLRDLRRIRAAIAKAE